MTTLYSLVSIGAAFRITRFDKDLNPESTYELDQELCSCPAGTKSTCRHRKMLPLFRAAGHVNDGFFLDWDTRLWRKPLAVVSEMFDDQEDKCGGLADPTIISESVDVVGVVTGRLPPAAPGPAAGTQAASPPLADPQPAPASSASSAAGGRPLFRRKV